MSRTAIERPDGSIEVSSHVDKAYLDLERYTKFKDGATILDIADEYKITVGVAKHSIEVGRNLCEADDLIRFRDLRYRGAIENEKIRQNIRDRVSVELVDAIMLLLSGKRTIPQVHKVTGEVTFKEFIDPDIIVQGIEAARKAISLEEKPAASQTTVNIQQNNAGPSEGHAAIETTYEERLTRIRHAQSVSGNRVIETKATEVDDDPAVAVTAELVVEHPDEDLGF